MSDEMGKVLPFRRNAKFEYCPNCGYCFPKLSITLNMSKMAFNLAHETGPKRIETVIHCPCPTCGDTVSQETTITF